ncbi:protein of unknown function [Burkholderia multivorans]
MDRISRDRSGAMDACDTSDSFEDASDGCVTGTVKWRRWKREPRFVLRFAGSKQVSELMEEGCVAEGSHT